MKMYGSSQLKQKRGKKVISKLKQTEIYKPNSMSYWQHKHSEKKGDLKPFEHHATIFTSCGTDFKDNEGIKNILNLTHQFYWTY